MSKSYTPGLVVLENTKIRKLRQLPMKGKVKVEVGEVVSTDQVIASTEIPGNVQMLNAANKLIANNQGRLGKNLWTEGSEGEPISLYEAFNEQDEARFIVDRLQEWFNKGNSRKDSASLYRSNAQSRELEEALLRSLCVEEVQPFSFSKPEPCDPVYDPLP